MPGALSYLIEKVDGLEKTTHCFTDKMKRFNPAAFLIPSNSGELKLGLYISSQMPRNSMVFLLRSHFSMRARPFSILRTMSGSEKGCGKRASSPPLELKRDNDIGNYGTLKLMNLGF